MSINDKSEALAEIRHLMAQFELGIADIQHALADDGHPQTSNVFTKVLAYIGGIFVFAGIAAFVALQ